MIVVGGGIGGLTAAIALRSVGIEPVVFERAPQMREVGAGVALWVNAIKAFGQIGLRETVRELGSEIGGEIRTWRGELLAELPASALRERFGEANLALHRADLQAALLGALPDGTVRLGSRFVGFEDEDGGVIARFEDGREERGDALVGADGLYSTVRAELFGEERPRYAGYTAWRGVATPEHELVPAGAGVNLWGRGSEFGLTNIGRGRFYWYMTRNAPEGAAEDPSGRKQEVLELLRGWYEPARAAVAATDEEKILRTDIYDREPLRGDWGEGCVTLLGDAAHPMTPNLGQGACQAIEDAVVLARCLEGMTTEADLRRYEGCRAARTATIVERSRLMGRWFHQLQSPLLCGLRDAAYKNLLSRSQMRQLDPIIGHEV